MRAYIAIKSLLLSAFNSLNLMATTVGIPEYKDITNSDAKKMGIKIKVREDITTKYSYIDFTVQFSTESQTILECYTPTILSIVNWSNSTFFMTELKSFPTKSSFRLNVSDIKENYISIGLEKLQLKKCKTKEHKLGSLILKLNEFL